MDATTTYPTCAAHTDHDMDCTPCYLLREHAENQGNPKASGHVTYPIKNCAACADEAVGELFQGEAPE